MVKMSKRDDGHDRYLELLQKLDLFAQRVNEQSDDSLLSDANQKDMAGIRTIDEIDREDEELFEQWELVVAEIQQFFSSINSETDVSAPIAAQMGKNVLMKEQLLARYNHIADKLSQLEERRIELGLMVPVSRDAGKEEAPHGRQLASETALEVKRRAREKK
uniref:Uncharacterized protein n=1 Tax=Hanusia phi TaxID=3032 RepID=A0A7S0ECI9_9CRYP